jgi:hypothetical protein
MQSYSKPPHTVSLPGISQVGLLRDDNLHQATANTVGTVAYLHCSPCYAVLYGSPQHLCRRCSCSQQQSQSLTGVTSIACRDLAHCGGGRPCTNIRCRS